jgi:sporulation protein YlmC with PRC-barrel domain
MFKVSELISMKVISIYESDYLGIIQNMYFDNKQKKCKYIKISNDDKDYSQIIKCNNIFFIGKECVFIKNSNSIDLEINYDKELKTQSTLINKDVYSIKGDYIGKCNDIILDKEYSIKKIILNNKKEIENSNIVNIGKIILISNTPINLSKFRAKQNIIKPTTNTTKTKVIILEKPQQKENKEIKNIKIITDYKFLIGRILNKDIIAINGEVIAKKDSIVTKDIVNRASSYGKLLEISRHSTKK